MTKRRKIAPKNPLLLIEWMDSVQPVPGWQFLNDAPALEAIRCQSVGWLVGETAKVKMIAPNIGGDFEQGSGFLRIPVRSIMSIRKLL